MASHSHIGKVYGVNFMTHKELIIMPKVTFSFLLKILSYHKNTYVAVH